MSTHRAFDLIKKIELFENFKVNAYVGKLIDKTIL